MNEKYIGIDIGKKTCVVCIMDQKGKVLEETSYGNTIPDITEFTKRVNKEIQKV